MSDEPVEPGPASSFLPLLRLLGVAVVGFALIELATSIGFDLAMEPIREPSLDPLADPFEDQEQAFRWLGVIGSASLGIDVVGHAAIAVLLALLARRAGSWPRIAAGLGSVAAVAMVVTFAMVFVGNIDPEPDDADGMQRWFTIGAAVRVLLAAALLALIYGGTRPQPARRAALLGTGVGLLASLLLLYPVLSSESLGPESGWNARWLHVSVRAWIHLLGSLGSGVGLWLASRPEESSAGAFDHWAARGLRLARTVVWWRVLLAVVAVVLVIGGTVAMQRSATHAMFGGGPATRELPWTLKAAPWLGHLEALLGVLLVLALASAMLQRRSRPGTILVGVGALLLLAGVAASMGLNGFFHTMLVQLDSPWGSIGGRLRDYAEMSAKVDAPMRWVGIVGMTCTLGGLMAIARRTGHPSPRRAVRFLVLVALFTGGWLYGRESLAELGTGAFLLAPVVIVGAIWALLDLTTYLAEVAEALEGEIPSSS